MIVDEPDLSMIEKPETAMADLPVQILAKIFDYFKSKDQQSLRAVCASWDFVINSLFKVYYRVHPHRWTTLLSTPGRFLYVRVSSYYLPSFKSSSHQVAPFQPFTSEQFNSFCYRLQELEFHELDFDVTCLKILQFAQSLKTLTMRGVEFSDWTCDSESGKDLRLLGGSEEVSNWLPMLKKLEFNSGSSTDLLKIIARIVHNGKLIRLTVSGHWSNIINKHDSNKVLQEYTRDGIVTPSNHPAPFDEVLANIISCNRATLRTIQCFGQTVQFNSSGSLARCQLRLQFDPYDHGSTPQTAINWMRALCDQNHLSDLGLSMRDSRTHAFTAEDIAEVKHFELLISEVISRDRRSLTIVDIDLRGKCKSDPEWATLKDGIFSKCLSLKYLEFKYYTGDIMAGETAENTIANVVFKGIETLPQSLKYFSIDFPISSTANNLEELDLTNLPNLEMIKLNCSFNSWFFFSEKNVVEFSGDDVKLLASKLPKLEYLTLNLEETPRSRVLGHGDQRIAPDLRNLLVPPELYYPYNLRIRLKEFLSGNAVKS